MKKRKVESTPSGKGKSTSDERKVVSLRDLRIERVLVNLPDAGSVEIYPYISAGAMSAAASAKNDREMLSATYGKSVSAENDVRTENFTEADWDYLAKHFLSADAHSNHAESSELYTTEIEAGGDARSAFAIALKMTTGWKGHQSSIRVMRREMESVSRMLEQHERTAASLLRQYDLPQLGTQFANLSLFDRYSTKMPEIHLGLQSSIERVLSEVRLHSAIQMPKINIHVPKFGFPNPVQVAFGRIENQLAGFQSIHDRQLETFKQFDAILKRPILPELGNLTGLASLNSAIASSMAQALDVNRLFASQQYMSPPRIRAEIISPDDSTEWIDDLEEAEEAVVIETLANRQLITSIVKEEMLLFRNELKRESHPYLNEFVDSLTNPEQFVDVLRLFTKRIAREDSRIFWSDYGKKFQPSPEAIGKSLLGVFLEGYCRGKAFIAHELRTGEGFVDVVVFFQGQTFILELKVVGAGWSFGKAKSGLNQLDYYEDMYADAEMFLIIFDGRKTERGERLPDETKLECGKTARVISVPIFTMAPTTR